MWLYIQNGVLFSHKVETIEHKNKFQENTNKQVKKSGGQDRT
jgi:hypothetical protein